MKKKLLGLTLIVAMLLSNSIDLYAAEGNEVKQDNVATAYLIDKSNGDVLEIPVTITNKSVEQEGDHLVVSTVAEFVLPIEEESGIKPYAVVTDGGVTTRIRFEMSYTKSGYLYRLDSVSGAYEQIDKAFTISDRLVTYTSQEDLVGYIRTYSPQSNTFSYTEGGTWVNTEGRAQYWIAGYAMCTISRGDSAWELECRQTVISLNAGLDWD